jgi:HK97 family phage portal protein
VAIVQSFGALQTTSKDGGWNYNVDFPQYGFSHAYATIFAKQPNVRTCVDFLARNIAQLNLHVFRRVSDTDRERLIGHDLATWITAPNPFTTGYRLIESLVADLAIYFNAYWLKVRLSPDRLGLVRLPPPAMRVEGGLLPSHFVFTENGFERDVSIGDVVYFNGFNPLNTLMGLSPLETLRDTLAGEAAAAASREAYWRNSSRMEGVIERPLAAPKWSPTQKQDWRTQWQTRYGGVAGTGMIPVLEDGMSFKAISYSAKDSEYLSSRKLSAEEVARAYHIPLPMVGILEHATFSNIKEQHKQLYADCLGPWLAMIQGELMRQLLPESSDTADIYCEFNIAEKLKGSFEEQTNALRVAVGRPFMTANEARGRLNLPSMKDDESADQLAAQQGGTGMTLEPRTTEPGASAPNAAIDLRTFQSGSESAQVYSIVRTAWDRQEKRLGKLPLDERAAALDFDRCTRELATDLAALLGPEEAMVYAARTTDDTYTLLLNGEDAFAASREPRRCELDWREHHAA